MDEAFTSLRQQHRTYVRSEYRLLSKEGTAHHVEIHAQPLYDGARMIGATGTITDVTDAVRFEAEREARERSEEILRLKTSFLNNMSHELRTPLAGIIGYAEALANEIDGDKREWVEPTDGGVRIQVVDTGRSAAGRPLRSPSRARAPAWRALGSETRRATAPRPSASRGHRQRGVGGRRRVAVRTSPRVSPVG